MLTSEIRSRFLKFFANNGHTLVESSSLVPSNDPTLLFTTAGMVQFKDLFLGKESRGYTRAASVQKCVRAGGKHNDLENVGFTARHHTFFEMLGNFSFGDYFKKEAIRLAWAFVTQELKIPKDKLYVTVFETDDEAANIWHEQENVPKDRIYRFGEKDNFWSMGDTGPCGPSSELFVDRGPKYSCGKPTCGMGCDCDRFMEFWNLVFMQYERSADGKLTPLPKPSVDTGAGLERIALILQEVDTNYETDGFKEIIDRTAQLAGVRYDPNHPTAVSFRVVADHSRASAFLVGDGVMPSNEGRGYVLRRIIRRAIRHGKKLGFTGPFLHKTAGYVVDQMKGAYPDLVEKSLLIEKAILAEEVQFFKTLERGLDLLDEELHKIAKGSPLSGDVAFKLYDTFGFPLDLTRVICEERGFSVDENGFERSMDRQRTESRKSWKGSGQESLDGIYLKLAGDLKAKNSLPKFFGYEKLQHSGICLALLEQTQSGLTPVQNASAGLDEAKIYEAIFSETPFYGESGGQCGDLGRVTGPGFEAEVVDSQKPVPDLTVIHLKIKRGLIKVGDEVLQETHAKIRALIARNHTATHLLHWALREVLGKHVKQAGSQVNPDLLRFDFSHFQPLSTQELGKIESLINEKIWNGDVVQKQEMGKDAAVSAGAIAFFGEKYGDVVRVVKVGDYSTELCGGTHVDRSSDIHCFKIESETGIAAGVRRIIAYTSEGAFNYLNSKDHQLDRVREQLKANTISEIAPRIEKILNNERDLKKQIESFHAKNAHLKIAELMAASKKVSAGTLIAAEIEMTSQGVKQLRDLSDSLLQKAPDAIVVLGMKDHEAGKANLLISVGPDVKSVKANELLKQIIPAIEGKGGGKPDLAQAGGTKISGLSEALDLARKFLS